MRRASVLLTAAGLLCWLTACSSSPDTPAAAPGSPTGPSVTGSPSTPPGTPSGPAATTGPEPPGQPSAAPTRPGRPGRPTAAPTPAGTGDLPGPLPFGERTLTGTVERAGDCTMLLVGERRWALTGDVAAGLRPGARVTVRGNLATRPAACGDRDLAQTVAVTRVDPA